MGATFSRLCCCCTNGGGRAFGRKHKRPLLGDGDEEDGRAGLRAGASGHNGHYGVFVLNYFPGPYWCGKDDCICEVQVTTATTVKSGSALRSCADETQGNLSTKTCLTAIVLPLSAVPPALRFH